MHTVETKTSRLLLITATFACFFVRSFGLLLLWLPVQNVIRTWCC